MRAYNDVREMLSQLVSFIAVSEGGGREDWWDGEGWDGSDDGDEGEGEGEGEGDGDGDGDGEGGGDGDAEGGGDGDAILQMEGSPRIGVTGVLTAVMLTISGALKLESIEFA